MLEALVAAARLTSGTSREIQEANVFSSAQSAVTLLDIRAHGVRAGNLLRNQPIAARILFQFCHVIYDKVEQLLRLSIASKTVQSMLAHDYSFRLIFSPPTLD